MHHVMPFPANIGDGRAPAVFSPTPSLSPTRSPPPFNFNGLSFNGAPISTVFPTHDTYLSAHTVRNCFNASGILEPVLPVRQSVPELSRR